MNDSTEILKARAMAVALDSTIAAISRPPAKPRKLQLDDCLSILEHACANFDAFDDHRVKDALADLWRAYSTMESAVAAVESEYPSEPEPLHYQDEA